MQTLDAGYVGIQSLSTLLCLQFSTIKFGKKHFPSQTQTPAPPQGP